MNIITVRYWGGMGNVLFEIAAAVAYSNKLNRPFLLAKYPAFPNLDNYTPTSIGLDEQEFKDSLKEFSEDEIAAGYPFLENQNILLTGFYQHYTLFDAYKSQILNILGIQPIRDSVLPKIHSPMFQSRGLFSADQNTPTISLHIRRGDYEDLKCYFVLLNEYYYKRALLHIANKLRDTFSIQKIKVLCFYERKSTESANQVIDKLLFDDLPFEFHHFNSILTESGVLEVSDIEEMAIMSHCSHHIIANSTYSWWSAYINPNPNKIVCYPNEYFNHQLCYLVNDGLKVREWTEIEAWNPAEYRCDCR
jgi:hypothetical protein